MELTSLFLRLLSDYFLSSGSRECLFDHKQLNLHLNFQPFGVFTERFAWKWTILACNAHHGLAAVLEMRQIYCSSLNIVLPHTASQSFGWATKWPLGTFSKCIQLPVACRSLSWSVPGEFLLRGETALKTFAWIIDVQDEASERWTLRLMKFHRFSIHSRWA